jgi:DNA-binding response OmpR family regulator
LSNVQSAARTIVRRALPAGGEFKRILLVEDDAELAAMLKEFLEAHCFRVSTVANGVDALKAVMERVYDLILCDVMMPKMAGDAFYYAVQRVKPALCERFIFITAHGDTQRMQEFLNHVSGMVLMKPFHLEDLLQIILLLLRDLEDTSRRLTLLDGTRTVLPFPTLTSTPPGLQM